MVCGGNDHFRRKKLKPIKCFGVCLHKHTMEEAKEGDLLERDFTVEAVRGARDGEDGKEYLIKWEGFSEEENTWEREEDLLSDGIMEEVKARLAEIAKQKKNRAREMQRRVARRRQIRDVNSPAQEKRDEMRRRVERRGVRPFTAFVAEKATEAAGAASKVAGKAVDYGLAVGKFHTVLLQLLTEAAASRTLTAMKKGKKAVEKAWDDAGGSVERFVDQTVDDAETIVNQTVTFAKKKAKAAPSATLRTIAEIAKQQKSKNTNRCKFPIGIPTIPGFYTRVETKVQAFTEAETASVTQKLNKVLLDACGDVLKNEEYEGDAEALNTKRARAQRRQIKKIVDARDALDILFIKKEKLKAALKNTFRDGAIDDLVVLLEGAAGAVDSTKQTEKDKRERAARLRKWFWGQSQEGRENFVKRNFIKANNKWKEKKNEVVALCDKFKKYVAADPRLKGGSGLQQKQKEDIANMIAMTMIRIHDAENGERFVDDFGKITPAISETHDPELTGYLTQLLGKFGVEKGKIFMVTAGLEGALDQLYGVPWLQQVTKELNKSSTIQWVAQISGMVASFIFPGLAAGFATLNTVGQFYGTAVQRYASIVTGIFLIRLKTLWDSKEKILDVKVFGVKVWLVVQSLATNFIMNCVPWLFAVNPMLAKYGVQILQFVTGALIAGVRAALLRTSWLNDPATMKKTFGNYRNNILQNRDITDADQINLRKLLTVRARNASFGANFLTRCFTLSDREVGFFLISPLASAFFTYLGGSTLFSVVGGGVFTKTGSTDYDEQTHMAVCTDTACTTIQVYKVGNTTDVRTLTVGDINFYDQFLPNLHRNMRNGSSMPNAATSLVWKEYDMFRYLVAKFANQQMSTGTWTGIFNALSAQWGSGEDTAINRALNYFVIPPSAQPSHFARFLKSVTNTAPPMRWLTPNQVKALFEREQTKQKIEQREKDRNNIKKIKDEFFKVIRAPTGAEKIDQLQVLSDEAAKEGVSGYSVETRTLGEMINTRLSGERSKLANKLMKGVTGTMNEIMKEAGFQYTYPSDDTELIEALKGLNVRIRSRLRKQLQGAIEECETMYITCRMDIRRVLAGFNSKYMFLAPSNPVSYDTNKILQVLSFAGKTGNEKGEIRLTQDDPAAPPPPRRDLGKVQEYFASDRSSVVILPGGRKDGESKDDGATGEDRDDGITIEDLDGDNFDTNDNDGPEVVENRDTELYIQRILRGQNDQIPDFETWLGDPTHQRQLVAAAVWENKSPNEMLIRLKHVKDVLKGATPSKQLQEWLSKEIDFAKAAIEWDLETNEENQKTIEEVKNIIRAAALSGKAALREANDKVRQLVENYQRRVREGELNNQDWQGWRPRPEWGFDLGFGYLGTGGREGASAGRLPMRLLPPRPARLAAPSGTRKLGIRRKRRYAFLMKK